MTIVICPVCKGTEDRHEERCGMCSDPGVNEPFCLHDRYEQFNAECECVEECERCGAEIGPYESSCWRCDP